MLVFSREGHGRVTCTLGKVCFLAWCAFYRLDKTEIMLKTGSKQYNYLLCTGVVFIMFPIHSNILQFPLESQAKLLLSQ